MSEYKEDKNSERRRHERIDLVTRVRYTIVMSAPETGFIQNISENGLCILVDKQLDKGMMLRLDFDLPGEKQEHIEALARIVWQRPKEDKFLIGVEFMT